MTSTRKSRRTTPLPRLAWREEDGVACADGRCFAYRLRPMPGRRARVMTSPHPVGDLPILPIPEGFTLRIAKALCQQAENAFSRAGAGSDVYLRECFFHYLE